MGFQPKEVLYRNIGGNGQITTAKLDLGISSAAIDAHGQQLYTKKLMEIIDQRIAEMGEPLLVEHKCHNCGATLLQDADKHIFACPYCLCGRENPRF